jgi:voltage-gated potassium channel
MKLRARLDIFIHHAAVEGAIMVMIVLSVLLMVLEVSSPPGPWHELLARLGDAITAIFAAELLIRFYVARNKRLFFRRYWIDILAVVPVVRSLRILRVLRVLRVFRMGLLLSRRLARVSGAFRGAAQEYLIIGLVTLILMMLGAVGIRLTEGTTNPHFASMENSFWWSVMTLVAGEPIGGEPTSAAGRLFTLLMMLSGLTFFAVFTGIVSAVMVGRLKTLNTRHMDIEELRGHIVICGWNRSGERILQELVSDTRNARQGIVVVAELQGELPIQDTDLDPNLFYLVRGDYTQPKILRDCGIPYADRAILLADRTRARSDQDTDARTVLAAITIERMNPSIFTSVELLHRENGEHLRLMGVEEIVVGDEYTGALLAMGARNRGIVTMMEELLTATYGNQFFKLEVPKYYQGKTVAEVGLDLRTHHRAMLLALETQRPDRGRAVRLNPDHDEQIQPDDLLVVIAVKRPRL